MSELNSPDLIMIHALGNAGLLDPIDENHFEPLTGGVSSDIWKVTTPEQVFCVKRALPKLKVEADWNAPVERNRYEVLWYQVVYGILPGAAPHILYHDEQAMFCAMSYLDPATHKLWKSELAAGRAEPEQAAQVGASLARIHSATAHAEDVWAQFPANDIFHAIRLEPYLEATARQHPDLESALFALSRRTAATRLALVHGDVSPKNILMGPNGPVFLDAECACIGDPTFDLAFCLNHLLLKCLWNPSAQPQYFACFEAMTQAYLARVDWEPAEVFEARAASLLPGLFLARVDGKSPVEYIHDENDKNRVRRCAHPLLINPPKRLLDVLGAWRQELNTCNTLYEQSKPAGYGTRADGPP